MMKVIKFRCGLCKAKEQFVGTRYGLRKHLREEHRIMHEITNGGGGMQRWWIKEDFA
jgi:hypothetical protein